MRTIFPIVVLGLLALAGCTTTSPAPPVAALRPPDPDQHLPTYVRRPPEPFSRANAIGIAQREWRAFGSTVNDDPAGSPSARPDQAPGLWQRVADYWWESQAYGASEGEWSSRYDASGAPYLGEAPAWSAAFISYVMRMAGAGTGFPYTPLHADYINAAARNEGVLRAERPGSYAPVPGDLICYGRRNARGMTFEDLPGPRFFGHCDIVVAASPGQLTVIGGNVAGGVTLKHVPTTAQGTLADASGRAVDGRYPWFVTLHVTYVQ